MFGKPGLPKAIPIVLQVIGWLFVVWFIVNAIQRTSPSTAIHDSSFQPWFHSMMFLHLVLGIIFILNGVALHKITTSVEKAVDFIAMELKKRSS